MRGPEKGNDFCETPGWVSPTRARVTGTRAGECSKHAFSGGLRRAAARAARRLASATAPIGTAGTLRKRRRSGESCGSQSGYCGCSRSLHETFNYVGHPQCRATAQADAIAGTTKPDFTHLRKQKGLSGPSCVRAFVALCRGVSHHIGIPGECQRRGRCQRRCKLPFKAVEPSSFHC